MCKQFFTSKRTQTARHLLALLSLAAIVSAPALTWGKSANSLNDDANKLYLRGEYKQALQLYNQADVKSPETPAITYNKANAQFKLGNLEEALKNYEKSLLSDDPHQVQAAHFNMGNVQFKNQDFQKAIESFQKAVEMDPKDLDAKYNLELARRRLKEQLKPQQQNEDQQQKSQDKQKNEQNQNQNKQNQDQQQQKQDQENKPNPQSQDQEERNKQDSSKQQPQDQKQQKQTNPDKMSKEDAERLLNSLKDEEEKYQKQKRKGQLVRGVRFRDW